MTDSVTGPCGFIGTNYRESPLVVIDREPGMCSWCILCAEILLKFDYTDFEPASNCYCSVCGTGMPPGVPPGKPR